MALLKSIRFGSDLIVK